MHVINKTVMYVGSEPVQQWAAALCGAVNNNAHWHVVIDLVTDHNKMSASMHDFVFVCKPTRKQLAKCKRDAIQQHEKDLAKFMKDYPHYFFK